MPVLVQHAQRQWIVVIILAIILILCFVLYVQPPLIAIGSRKIHFLQPPQNEVSSAANTNEQTKLPAHSLPLPYEEIESLRSEIKGLQEQLEMVKNFALKLTEKQHAIDRSRNHGAKQFPNAKPRSLLSRKRILVTGGAGFVGSHLVDYLMRDGHEVIALDNFFTGRRRNIEQWVGHPNFELVHHDIVNPYYSEVDQIYHLASPASPPRYMYNPVKTLKTNTLGTINILGLARRVKARVLFASSSEVYGDPEVSPQSETYLGRVNTIGPRACYDEGKRAAEALMSAFHKQENVDIRIARIFNTFGPKMDISDGRVVSNFIIQAIRNEPITIYGAGNQTRAFQYVSDLVDGLVALMQSNTTLPVNIGNPKAEYTIDAFARLIVSLVDSNSSIVFLPKQEDDPQQRRPDIGRAKRLLGWEPKVGFEDGLRATIAYFRDELKTEEENDSSSSSNEQQIHQQAIPSDVMEGNEKPNEPEPGTPFARHLKPRQRQKQAQQTDEEVRLRLS